MKIGVPSEVKNNEHRVGLTESVKILSDLGHQLFVQSSAGHAMDLLIIYMNYLEPKLLIQLQVFLNHLS